MLKRFNRAQFAKTAALLFVCSGQIILGYEAYKLWRAMKVDRATFNMLVRRDAGLPIQGKLDRREASLKIRDWVYRSFRPGKELPNLEPSEVYAVLASDSQDMVCDGASRAYQWALDAVGIPARMVYLAGTNFLAGKDVYQGHATVEILLDKDWEISDPTFNVSFDCSDGEHSLSVPSAAKCLKSGFDLLSIPGKTQIPQRTIAGYYEPIGNFFAAWKRFAMNAHGVHASLDESPQTNWFEDRMRAYNLKAKEKKAEVQ